MLVGDMGVNLRRGNGRMPQHGLDAADVGAAGEQVGGEAVAERVRMNILHQPGFGGVELYNPLDRAGSDS